MFLIRSRFCEYMWRYVGSIIGYPSIYLLEVYPYLLQEHILMFTLL